MNHSGARRSDSPAASVVEEPVAAELEAEEEEPGILREAGDQELVTRDMDAGSPGGDGSMGDYLPSITALLTAGPDGCRCALFTPLEETGGTTSVLTSLWRVLDDRARSKPIRPFNGIKCFSQPLHDGSGVPVCMEYDAQKVRHRRYMYVDDGGYLLLFLGIDRGARRLVFDRAHRFLLWSMYGPAPACISRPVAMHTCNNPACLNPEHIVWGEDQENWKGGEPARQECLRRLLQQRKGLVETEAMRWLGMESESATAG